MALGMQRYHTSVEEQLPAAWDGCWRRGMANAGEQEDQLQISDHALRLCSA